MKIKVVARSFALILALTVLPIASAQDGLHDWNVVQAIAPGAELIIETKTAETIKGKLSNTVDTTLRLSQDGRSVVIEQINIHRIYLVEKRSRTRSAWNGALQGAAIGFRLARSHRGSSYAGVNPTRGALFGLPAGAIVGAVRDGKGRRGQLIYETK